MNYALNLMLGEGGVKNKNEGHILTLFRVKSLDLVPLRLRALILNEHSSSFHGISWGISNRNITLGITYESASHSRF